MASPRGSGKTKATTQRRPVRPGQNAPRSEKVQASITRIVFNRIFLLSGLAVLSAAGLVTLFILWFNRVYADPENVFWGMVSNNLSTSGVTKGLHSRQPGGDQTEYTQLSLNKPAARSVKILDLKDESGQPARLTLEGILTPSSEYQRYSRIERPGAGRSDNFKAIYDMWLELPVAPNGRSAGFDNAFFGALLFGNFNRQQRQQIIEKLRNSYALDFDKADKKIVDGRRTYTYELTVNMRKYAEAILEYAKHLGVPAKGALNPKDFSAEDKITVEVTVDTMTRQVKAVRYDQTVTETYKGYGIPAELTAPERTVTSEQLQKALQDASR